VGLSDFIFCIRQIMEKVEEFKNADELVWREILYSVLIELRLPKKLVRLIKIYVNKTDSKVHIGKYLSDNEEYRLLRTLFLARRFLSPL
jgi:hypothetical protein